MNFWDDPKFSQPTDEVGDWNVTRSTCFEHEDKPAAMKFAIEKMTGQLLQREPLDAEAPVLRYAGTSGAGGYPCTVRLELVAVGRGRHLYRFTNEGSAPRRWEKEAQFTAACEHRFAHWCGQLRLVADERTWPDKSQDLLDRCVTDVVAHEDAAARVVEDRAPVVALQLQVLDALRGGGMGFFAAGKEGGTQLFFDGSVFRRTDDGEGTDQSAVYADGAAMIDALRHFYDWDARRDCRPHAKPEVDVWRFIHGQLRPR